MNKAAQQMVMDEPTMKLGIDTFNLSLSKSVLNKSGILLSPFLKSQEAIADEKKTRKLLIIDQSSTTTDLIMDCLGNNEDGYEYEIMSAMDHDSSSRMFRSLAPDIIIADWNTMIKTSPKNDLDRLPASYTIPVILMIDEDVSYSNILRRHISDGIVDCVRKPVSMAEIKARVLLLFGFIEQLCKSKKENSAIRNEMNVKHMELHLELLMHSGNVKDKFLQDVNQLSPYLTMEGRSKLKHLVKQFKWAMNDENSSSFVRAFDKLNAPLYKSLEVCCACITRNEKRLCAFVAKDQSGSEIAKIMGKTQNSVNVAFARLRAKLGFTNNKDLKMFLASISS